MSILDKLVFLVYLLPGSLFGPYQPAAGKMPGDMEVLRELHKILRQDPFFREQARPVDWNIHWLSSVFENLAKILHYPLLLILGIAILLGLYFLIRAVSPYVQVKSFQGQPAGQLPASGTGPPPDHFLALYRLALEQSRTEDYGQALISLHKATVEYLLTRIIAVSAYKKYTNNDLKRKLAGNQTYYQPFCIIAGYAEIAGFSTIGISREDFNRALETFETSFL
jgi:hypothetical protein